jgi:DNA invertase Pin-like site-specific DNA recombinase
MAKYGYIRVSTKKQANKGNSLEDQRNILIEEGVPAENIFVDKCTGTKMERPEFDKLLAKLKKGDELVVTKIDRFARTTVDGIMTIRDLVNRGVRVNILNMGVADNTPMGKLMVTILLAFAEFERDMIIERTLAGKEIAMQKEDYQNGRKTKRTPEFEEYLTKVERGEMTIKAACTELGISANSFRRYREAV